MAAGASLRDNMFLRSIPLGDGLMLNYEIQENQWQRQSYLDLIMLPLNWRY
jgi:hypothetical protein